MSFPTLDPSFLYLLVFGAGFGESVLVRVPPDRWIVVDGCHISERSPAAHLLRQLGQRWACVVLTHPHLDHAPGLDDVLTLQGGGPLGCAEPLLLDPASWVPKPSPEALLRHRSVQQVAAAFHRRWQEDPSSRWEVRRHTARAIGDATVTALHPDDATVAAHAQGNPNRLAAGLLVEWKGLRLLLGSDVVALDWQGIAGSAPNLGAHVALKVPHHGSREAIDPGFAVGTRERVWIASPYNKGRKLPRCEDGQGLAMLLGHVDEVHLTGLPVAHDQQHQAPCQTTRQDLLAGRAPAPTVTALPSGLTLTRAATPTDPLRNYVLAGFDAQGVLRELRHGDGSVRVRESSASPPGVTSP